MGARERWTCTETADAPTSKRDDTLSDDKPSAESNLSLAADFPAAGHDQWLRLVDKVLAGAPFEKKLLSRTYDGLGIQPLYTRADWNAAGDPSGLPGGVPFTRGGRVLGTSVDGWDIRQSHRHPDPTTVNTEILNDLERGVASIVLVVDPNGENGTAVRTAHDLDRALQGVQLDLAPVVLQATGASLAASVLLMNLLDQRRVKAFAGNFGLDVLGELAVSGKLAADVETELARMADAAAHVAAIFPKARAVNIRTVVFHSAGAADAQELGCAMASGVEYLRVMTAAGLDIDSACGQIAFTAAVDADFFMSIAKVRALRKLWSRVAEACGAGLENRTAPITACSAPRMMSKRDPWVNVLRTTVACFAAGVAGADAITVLPFDAAIGLPGDLGRRIARNTQIVLQEESSLARVVDPAGGAWMFERLTDELAEKAWAFFQEIEKQGGMAKALAVGFVAGEIAKVHAERAKNIGKRKDVITGVSEFPNIHEATFAAVRAAATRPARPSGAVPPLPVPGKGKFTAALAKAAAGGANIAALMKACSGTKPATLGNPLPNLRLAEGFEQLRDASDEFKATYGGWPAIFLANIGTVADFTGRAAFAKNFFEAGGIEAIPGAGGAEVAAIVRDFKGSAARFAVLCGTDALYAGPGAAIAKALKDAGAAVVYLAGRGGDQEAALRAAGVDEFIFIGCDAKAILTSAHQRLAAGR